ncbi:hypothetical protein C8R47DRAFT_584064 [Mycena vitilis]|nr:hypothetical protein C8R47DRAFT_584064 [Mycena vitilis]
MPSLGSVPSKCVGRPSEICWETSAAVAGSISRCQQTYFSLNLGQYPAARKPPSPRVLTGKEADVLAIQIRREGTDIAEFHSELLAAPPVRRDSSIHPLLPVHSHLRSSMAPEGSKRTRAVLSSASVVAPPRKLARNRTAQDGEDAAMFRVEAGDEADDDEEFFKDHPPWKAEGPSKLEASTDPIEGDQDGAPGQILSKRGRRKLARTHSRSQSRSQKKTTPQGEAVLKSHRRDSRNRSQKKTTP